jgi:PAS domain S-box-containing protein
MTFVLTTKEFSEELFQYIWDNLRDIIFTLDSKGLITSISHEFETITGIKREKVIGKHFIELVIPEDHEIVIEGFNTTIQGESPPPYSARVSTKNGEIVVLEAKATPQWTNGEISGYLGIARDITKRNEMEEALRASEEQYRIAINSIGDPIHVINPNYEIKLANHAFSSWLRRLKLNSSIIGMKVTEAFPFLPPEINEEYDLVFKNGKAIITEEKTEIQGEEYFTETRKVPIFNKDESNVIQVLTIIRDITESHLMAKQVRESEERLRGFMDGATDVFSIWDSELNLLDVNRTGIEKFGMGKKKEDIVGKPISAFIPNPEHIKLYFDVLETGEAFILDGAASSKIYGDIIVSQKAFKMGEGLGIITTDITERKKIENELRENEERFRSIFENAPIGMSLTSLNFQFIKVNEAFCRMLGYTELELTQLSFPDITHPDHKRRDIKFAQLLIEGDIQVYETEKQYIKKTGDPIWARITVTLLRKKKGEPDFFLAMMEDISALKEKEEELKSQLLKFKIEDGKMYLIKETLPRVSKTVFEDLTKVGYNGYIVSRTPEKESNISIKEKTTYFHLTEKNNINSVLNQMKNIGRKSVFLFDRLEYLFIKEGFNRVAKLIFNLNELAYMNSLVVLLSLDSSTLDEREILILERETYSLEPRFIAKFSEEFLDILKYIFQQNGVGVKPSYSDVGEVLEISRPTARKRIKHLVSRGYLIEHQTGKSKFLELSGKGELLFLS